MSFRARGRHRKPSTTGRTIGLATAPLVAVIPLSASPAGAATTATWDRLARCESGGNWHINTGNGYYGGLQFSPGTWDAYGGNRFASNAHRATKAEQITVAERLLDARGWSPWPACSRKLGLDASDRRGNPDGTAERASRSKPRKATTTKVRKAKPVSTRRAGKVYVVRRGDTLSGIAARRDVPGGWQKLYKINKRTIGKNPGLIRPGQRLVLR
jgi:resuscitation-promoting factor RpfA